MKTLGIFGDSYSIADQFRLDTQFCWVDVLKEKYSVDNYSKAGSSLYYSFVQFKENFEKYDKIIFVVTNASRIWTRHIYNELDSIGQAHLSHINNLELLNQHYKNLSKFCPEKKLILKTFEAAIGYYSYIQNTELDIFTAAGLIYEIKNLRPDVLMVASLPSYIKDKFHANYLSDIIGHRHFLAEICLLETAALGFDDWEKFSKYLDKKSLRDTRHCHITDENNIILGNKMLQWIENGQVTLNLEDFVTPSSFDEFKRKYLIKNYENT